MASSSPARQSHGEVAHDDHHGPREVVVNGVSSLDEPSVEWGWNQHYPKVAEAAGFISAFVMLIMIWGNHEGRQEDIWLVVLAVGFLALSIGSIMRRRRSWRH